MLSKKMRLTREQFDIVWKKGKRVHTPLFQMIYLADAELPKFRTSVVIGKKAIKSAVIRHLIKRRIYAWLRTQSILVPASYSYVFLVKKQQQDLTYALLASHLKEVMAGITTK